MKIIYFSQSAFSFVSEIRVINTRNKKIALLAVVAFALIAACYFAASYFIKRSKDALSILNEKKTPFENVNSPAYVKEESADRLEQSPRLKIDPSPDLRIILQKAEPVSPQIKEDRVLPEEPQKQTVTKAFLDVVPAAIPAESTQTPQNARQKTPPSPTVPAEKPTPHRMHKYENNELLPKVEKPTLSPQISTDPKEKLGGATPLQTRGVEKAAQQKEERKEIIYLFSPYHYDDSDSAEYLLSTTFPGLAEIKTSLEKTYQQVVFTNNPQIVKKGAPVLFFLGKDTRIDFHPYNVIEMMERLGGNVLILLFSRNDCSRYTFKEFLMPESVQNGPGKGKIAADVLEKYRNFDSFLIYEYFTSISNTGVGDPIIVNKFRGNPNPAQEILKKIKDMEPNADYAMQDAVKD